MLELLDSHSTELVISLGITSHFMEQPTTLHFQVVKHILPYVKGTINYGKGCEIEYLDRFIDSDLRSDLVGSKGTS